IFAVLCPPIQLYISACIRSHTHNTISIHFGMYGMLYFSCCVLSMSASFLFLVAYCVWLFYNVFIFFAGLLSCLCNICQLIYFFQRDVPAGDASVRSPLISSHLNRSHLIRTALISSYTSTTTPPYNHTHLRTPLHHHHTPLHHLHTPLHHLHTPPHTTTPPPHASIHHYTTTPPPHASTHHYTTSTRLHTPLHHLHTPPHTSDDLQEFSAVLSPAAIKH